MNHHLLSLAHEGLVSVSATPDKNMSSRMPLASSADVLLPYIEASVGWLTP